MTMNRDKGPRRGQGLNPAPQRVSGPINNVEEPIHICIDKWIPEELHELSAEIAIAENADNIPIVPMGVSMFLSPAQMALITGKKWQVGRVINCAFMGGEKVVQDKVIKWAKEWEKYANIKFNFITDLNKSEIRIAFDNTDGSWSYIGTDCLTIAKNQSTMNYGWLEANTVDEEYSRVVQHEFGHALGCIHEHQHPEAGIPWNKDAVYKYYMGPPNNWTKADVDNNLFGKYSKNITQFSAWDKTSIMEYAVPASLTTNGFSVGWNTTLSELDKKFISEMYPFDNKDKNNSFITRLIQLVLNRKPLEVELDSYNKILSSEGRAPVINSIESTDENILNFTNKYYQILLNRKATTEEFSKISSLLKRKITEEQVIAEIIGSDEFYKKCGNDNVKFVKTIYSSLLSHEPLPIDLSHWLTNLKLYGRTHVALTILKQKEWKFINITEYYQKFLNRLPTSVEMNAWGTTDLDLAKIRYSIEGSQEFYNGK